MQLVKILTFILIFQSILFSQETTVHKYRLIVKDAKGKFISQQKIKYTFISDLFNSKKIIHGETNTSVFGEAVIAMKIPIEWEWSSSERLNALYRGIPKYSSMLLYEIKDSLHYPIEGSMKSYKDGMTEYSPTYYKSKEEWIDLLTTEIQENTVTLSSKEDYFSNNVLTTKDGKKYKDNLEQLVDHLILNKIPETLTLKYNSISFELFKNNLFFQLVFKAIVYTILID